MRTQPEPGRALQQAREQMDALFHLVRPAAFYDRPIGERHRMIFYLGHADAFDWNLIARYALDVPAFHEEFDRLFAFGIDPPPGELPSDQPGDWPALDEVERYQQRTREIIDELLGRGSGAASERGHRASSDACRDVSLTSCTSWNTERR